jgi:hypothetical protein
MYGSVVFQTTTVVDGTTQSNSYDCGCHAIMDMRIMASATVLHHGQFEWPHLQMPTGASRSRDAEWHSELAEEVIRGDCELWQVLCCVSWLFRGSTEPYACTIASPL